MNENVKTIQVHPETYRYLSYIKEAMISKEQREITYEDVIINHINELNNLKSLIIHLIRDHPELKPTIEGISKKIISHQHIRY